MGRVTRRNPSDASKGRCVISLQLEDDEPKNCQRSPEHGRSNCLQVIPSGVVRGDWEPCKPQGKSRRTDAKKGSKDGKSQTRSLRLLDQMILDSVSSAPQVETRKRHDRDYESIP